MKICLALPVYNEESVLEKNVNTIIFELKKYSSVEWEIIIADNGSTDRTSEIVKKIIKNNQGANVKYFYIKNPGRGRAIRRAWSGNTADWYFFMDIDLAVDLKALADLVKLMNRNEADIIIGSRYVPSSTVERKLSRTILSEVYNFLCRRIVHLNVTDAQCGWKAINKKITQEILPQTTNCEWFLDTELLALAQANNKKIIEMPVEWVETRDGKRHSKVKILKTIWDYLILMVKLRKRLKVNI